ncbi:MAG: pyridoxamine 5'-phosphate oxidase family protein [Proteobacteria bacterium]|nr:pyridoxamine 5'-phosphate oxidase family protein [Pseudomonadota bacterium]
MKQKEMRNLINKHAWATLCTVDPEGKPYAIEFTYFLMDGYICGLINPRGATARNIRHGPNVCLKMCRADELCKEFQAVSCFGTGEFVDDREAIGRAWDLLERKLNLPEGAYHGHKGKFMDKRKKSPLFRMKPEKITGVTSTREPLN